MPRRPRLYIPGVSLHVIHRGNNRLPIFGDEADREVFLAFLKQAAMRFDVAVHAFALMSNHSHLIVTPGGEHALPRAMKEFGERYVRYYNKKCERVGTLWCGRYRALMIQDERYLLTCLRYVEQNPVRAGLVRAAEMYPWSSYRVHALGADPEWLVPHATYIALGNTREQRQAAYRALCGTPVTDAELEQQRHWWGQTGVRLESDPGPDRSLTPAARATRA